MASVVATCEAPVESQVESLAAAKQEKAESDFGTRDVLRKILPAAGGSFIEWYEFAIYTYMANYITANFFADGRGGSLGTWAGFAVTFACRPIGGALFGWYADKCGRKPAMQLSISLMLVTTVLQGCLPTFSCCGEAWGWFGLVALLVLRALQGLSVGGELSTAAVYITEMSPRESLGFYLSWISVTGAFGAWIVAALMVFLMESLVSPAAMYSWAWRLPYLTTLLPGLFLVMTRKNLEETKEFEGLQQEASLRADIQEDRNLEDGAATCEKKAAAPKELAPMQELLRDHKLALLLGTFGTMGLGSIWFVLPLFGTQFVQQYDGLPENMVTLSQAMLNLIPTLLAPIVGMWVDAWGVGKVHLLTLVVGGLLIPGPLMYWWTHVSPEQALVAIFIGQGILGLVFALTTSVYLWVVELFPSRVRATGVSISYNIGVGIVGGMGPVLSALGNKVVDPRGLISAPAAYVLLTSLLSVAAVAVGHVLSRRGAMRLTHIRSSPY